MSRHVRGSWKFWRKKDAFRRETSVTPPFLQAFLQAIHCTEPTRPDLYLSTLETSRLVAYTVTKSSCTARHTRGSSTVAMRLLTHNLLACHAKACQTTSNNFPLVLKDVQLELIEAEPNEMFVKGFLPKLDWPALVKTARSLGDTSLPDQGPDPSKPLEDADLIQLLHHVLLEVSTLALIGKSCRGSKTLCLDRRRCWVMANRTETDLEISVARTCFWYLSGATDPRRRRSDDLSKLPTHLSDSQRYPQHAAC